MRRILALTVFLALLLFTPAAAHQQLVSASPAEGASLSRVPGEIRLTFNQDVDVALAGLRLVGPGGEIALAPLEVPADEPGVLLARIRGALAAGAYSVEWRVTGDDGHPVRGEYRFVIEPGAEGIPGDSAGAAAAAVDPGPPAPGAELPPAAHHAAAHAGGFDAGSPLYAAVRWLTFAGIVIATGAVAFTLLLIPAMARRGGLPPQAAVDRAVGRAAAIGLLAGAGLALALVLRLFAQSAALHGPGAAAGPMMGAMLTRTFWGWGWILQAAATAVLLGGLWRARSGVRGGWSLAGGAAVALAFTPALSGHAVATSALAVVSDGLHVLSAGGWLGTLLLMVVVGLPLLAGTPERRTEEVASLLGAFSPLALTFAGILTLTGVHAAWLHLPQLSDLWTSAYGRTLLLKLAALAVVFGTGAYNWLRAKPALEKGHDVRPLRRSATAELVMGAVVLAVTAALVATPPPEPPASVAIQPEPRSTSPAPSPSR
jgi:putative copper export protein/methionine-rich copper-binding protein CopC